MTEELTNASRKTDNIGSRNHGTPAVAAKHKSREIDQSILEQSTRDSQNSAGTNKRLRWPEDVVEDEWDGDAPTIIHPLSAHPIFGVALNAVTRYSRGVKRIHSAHTAEADASLSRAPKRPRNSLQLDEPSTVGTDEDLPTSSLFFSQTPRERPQLPPRFSSSEASAAMMKKVNAEETSSPSLLQRMKLSRNSAGPMSPTSRHPPRSTSNKTNLTDESEIAARGLKSLSQVGVLELLEQDDRLIFIIDLSNRRNFLPGPLSLLFSNTTLKGVNSVHNAIKGRISDDPRAIITGIGFPEFKAWATSFVENDKAMDLALPAYTFGGAIWTCSHLRKNFRVFYGLLTTGSGRMASVSLRPSNLAGIIQDSRRDISVMDGIEKYATEPSDYFGTAINVPEEASSIGTTPDRALNPMETPSFVSRQLMHSSTNSSKQMLAVSPARTPDDLLTTEILTLEDLGEHGEGRQVEYPLGLLVAEEEVFDWTRVPFTPALPKHIQFARGTDWASTSLGPINEWPGILRSISNLLMAVG